jgi:DNA-binding HxlR family transcriptional regulator
MHESEGAQIGHGLRIVALLQRKWTLHILWAMQTGPVRLSTLKRLWPAASKKALRAGLRDLEQAKLIVRHDLSTSVLHVEYEVVQDLKETIFSVLGKIVSLENRLQPENSEPEETLLKGPYGMTLSKPPIDIRRRYTLQHQCLLHDVASSAAATQLIP